MPYYGYYGIDMYYIVLVLPCVLFAFWAQNKVNSTFNRYSQVQNLRGLTGAQAAEAVLRYNGVSGVRIEYVSGKLTDHFDPRSNVIRLSSAVYSSTSVASIGVAAHEAGHAVQYAIGYAPIKLRAAIIPLTQFGSMAAMPLLILGLILNTSTLVTIGIAAFALSTLFQLVTLRRISQSLMDRIHRNYRFIVGFNLGLILLGVAGILPPTTSALLHNASTLGISLKSMTDLLPEPEATVPERSGE